MKKALLCIAVFGLTACKSTDIRNISDSVSEIASIGTQASGAVNGTSSVPAYEHPNQQYSVSNADFYITDAVIVNPERGTLRPLRTEKNPTGITMVRYEGFHQDSGVAMKSKTYIYSVNADGFLNEKAITSHNANAQVVNSGQYYLKAQADTGKFYASGMIMLQRGVTNVISYDLR